MSKIGPKKMTSQLIKTANKQIARTRIAGLRTCKSTKNKDIKHMIFSSKLKI